MLIKKSVFLLLGLVIMLFFSAACTDLNAHKKIEEASVIEGQGDTDESDTTKDDISLAPLEPKANFQWIQQNIIEPECLSCHNENFSLGNLLLTSYAEVMSITVSGNPEGSPLYLRSSDTNFFTLTVDEQEILRIWIQNGAENN